ncbi:hypothetical protein EGR_08103 [Echinococcus granulosus]|uniref:Secreted protein n=1 Tax=Echinococcus granulosus TaxID=6210 RepID=W6UG05_ECHGR|nr:hypothetical protein EGR_08103 [Echinococcus granulosus]EUB57027.1 hypothetical protein EGR_08103 [Echinococcus granulosus]
MGKLGMPFLTTLTLTLLLTTRESCCTRLQNAPPAMLSTVGLLASSHSQPPPDPYDLVPPTDDSWGLPTIVEEKAMGTAGPTALLPSETQLLPQKRFLQLLVRRKGIKKTRHKTRD